MRYSEALEQVRSLLAEVGDPLRAISDISIRTEPGEPPLLKLSIFDSRVDGDASPQEALQRLQNLVDGRPRTTKHDEIVVRGSRQDGLVIEIRWLASTLIGEWRSNQLAVNRATVPEPASLAFVRLDGLIIWARQMLDGRDVRSLSFGLTGRLRRRSWWGGLRRLPSGYVAEPAGLMQVAMTDPPLHEFGPETADSSDKNGYRSRWLSVPLDDGTEWTLRCFIDYADADSQG